MGNWIFLILLYLLFGWMKKKHQAKSRKEIESQEDWDTETPPASRFGVKARKIGIRIRHRLLDLVCLMNF